MKVPRDVSGMALASRPCRYGYEITRQSGSHLRLTSSSKGSDHHITVPRHKAIRVGTLASILAEVSDYLKMDHDELVRAVFG